MCGCMFSVVDHINPVSMQHVDERRTCRGLLFGIMWVPHFVLYVCVTLGSAQDRCAHMYVVVCPEGVSRQSAVN